MIFAETRLKGAFVIELEPRHDARGFCARTFCQNDRKATYVPHRFAHGYRVLVDGTETSYPVSEFDAPALEGGLHYDDPRLGLEWLVR
jgi:dTDP-4-dehydrorhamnose 3,5-epimerase